MLEARNLVFAYPGKARVIDNLSLSLAPGEIIGLSGASGCGKSTLGRLLAGYLTPDGGSVFIDGQQHGPSPVQYVHQSAIHSVDPRWRIGRIVEEAWAPDDQTRDALGVSPQWYDRYPHEVSGGELQRVTLLRAMAPTTRYLIADELTAMLDPITQADIWRFLLDRAQNGLAVVAISHDQPLLTRVARRILRLQAGALNPL